VKVVLPGEPFREGKAASVSIVLLQALILALLNLGIFLRDKPEVVASSEVTIK
jgi:hypothetical protein